MRFKNILLLALLLYNARQCCSATKTEHIDKPAAESTDKIGGRGGVGIENGSENINIYEGKIGGQQTSSPMTTSTKLQKHTSQTISKSTAPPSSPPPSSASSTVAATYVTSSTTSSQRSSTITAAQTTSKSHTTPALAELASVEARTRSNYNQKTSAPPIQAAFAYKAIVPTHEEQPNNVNTAIPNLAATAYNDDGNGDSERDGASSKKIIGSSVVTSVSVILNGEEPEFTDAVGHKVPKPQPSLQVASPIDLLNPDRYEFYTFDDNGELVKRLMTMQEIQSIVANGDGEGPTIIHPAPIDERDPEKNVQDIVNSVQTVLNTHVDSNTNTSTETLPVLDTPDVSSSWSMILPAIFGNTGGIIFPQEKPQQIIMMPDSELLETSTQTPHTTRKPKPSKRKPGQKRKTSTTTTTEMTPQIVQEELEPYESVYTGMEQYQNIAANVQNFEGLEDLNLKPFIQKLPMTSQETETTTRHVFVNNQEIIQISDSTTTTTTERSEIIESFGKKPHFGPNKQSYPHRHKIPYDDETIQSTKRPQVTHAKQKIKKKPTTTTSTISPIPETTTTLEPTSTPSTIPTVAPTLTTQKKKRKKPTRQPVTTIPANITTAHSEHYTHYTKPHPVGEKRKPTQKPAVHEKPIPAHVTSQHNKHPIIHDETATQNVHQKPRPTHTAGQHNKHPISHDETTTGSIHQKPKPTHATIQHNKHQISHDETTTGSIHQKPRPTHTGPHNKYPIAQNETDVPSIHQKPKPTHTIQHHKKPIANNETTPSIIHQKPGLTHTASQHNKHPIALNETGTPIANQKPKPTHTTIQHNKHPIVHDQTASGTIQHTAPSKINHHKRPRPHKTTTTTTTTTTTVPATSSNDNLIVESYPGLPSEPSVIGSLKHESQVTTITQRPLAYPVPSYDINKPSLSMAESVLETEVQKKPLPSLSMIQQQQYPQLTLTESSTANEDLDTMMSFDQLMQSLKGDENNQEHKLETQHYSDPSKQPILPIKYDSAESIDKLEEMAEKKKKLALTNMSTAKMPIIATTVNPMTAHYGGSTLATMLAGEEYGITGRPAIAPTESTESSSTEETTIIHTTEEKEDNTPFVLITQRPIYFATTRKPEEIKTTYVPQTEEAQTEISDTLNNTQAFETTVKPEKETESYTQSTTSPQPVSDQASVVKFEPLYAEDTDPVVTEITTPTPEYEATTFNYAQSEETTIQKLADELESIIDDSTSMDSTESETVAYTTQNMLRLPVSVPQKVDEMLAGDGDSTENPPNVADLKPHLNMEILKPTDQILMGDFQTQAATVASTLVDGTNTVAAETFMSSNETKDEIQFLMSDVLQQMTSQDQYKLEPPEPEANRLTSFAQLNSSFLMKPTQTSPTQNHVFSTTSSSSQETLNYGQGSATVAMEASAELLKLQHTASIDREVPTTELTPAYETTTIIPSKEELIKIEEDYLNSIRLQDQITTTNSPSIEYETTPFRVPILSLSEIYAQQQQQEDAETESSYEAEKETIYATEHNSTEKAEETAEQMDHETSKPNNEYTHDEMQQTEELNSSEESLEQGKPTTQVTLITISSEEKLSSESNSQEQITTNASEQQPEHLENNAIYNNLNSQTVKQEAVHEQQPEHSENSTNDSTLNNHTVNNEHIQIVSKEDDNSKYATMINEPMKEDIDIIEKQSVEQIYASMINEPSVLNQQPLETMSHTLEEQTQPSTEIKNPYDSLKEQSLVEIQTTAVPIEEYVTQTNINKDEKLNESISTSMEESTEQPQLDEVNTTISEQETTALPIYEKTPPAYTMNTETSEEMLDELLTTMFNETGLLDTPEDVYIKLGESTAKPVEALKSEESPIYDVQAQQSENQPEKSIEKVSQEVLADKHEILVQSSPSPLLLLESTESTESAQTQLQEKVSDFISPSIHIPVVNELPDSPSEEDDNEPLTDYQQPLFFISSTSITTTTTSTSTTTTTTPKPSTASTTKRLNTLKPVSYYKQPSFGLNQQAEPPKVLTYTASAPQQRPMQRPAALSNLMATSTQATRPPVKLEPSPDFSKGLEASVSDLDGDVLSFARLCNELAFSYWKSITSEKISSARSLILSPFALTSMLSMVFLGARGGTSGEMNEILKLDDMVTFNPHLIFKNITDSVEKSSDADIATAAFVREIFSDRNNGKILQFFKEKTQQFYAGHVEEVNFHVVNDIIRRRTNLLIKRHTMGKVLEYLRTNSVWVNGPLATISANLFQTDCSHASTQDRDGEMFFQVHPTVRQRRLVPIPAVLYKSGFTAGYEPKLDATVVAFGRIEDTVSTIYVMPGHQSSISPTDNLERLQDDLVELAFKENAWSNILTSLMDRPGMEVQLPRFSHRSFVNASLGLQKMGLKGLFKSDFADLRGLTGSSNRDIFLSDMIQINTFSTCGEERISDHHHVEMYPAPPLRKRNKDVDARENDEYDSSEAIIDFGSLVHDATLGRGFYDDLLDPKYLELPLPLRPRQARVPDTPRLRFDKPFLYFVRHNPTGMILFMGRFNPRLLP